MDVDTSLPGVVFKTQLFTLSGVPPERQKIMGCKNAPLKARAPRRAEATRRADVPASAAGRRRHDSRGFEGGAPRIRAAQPPASGCARGALAAQGAALTPRGPARAQGCKLMLMGSADAIPTAPSAPVVFVEDLPDAAQAKASMARASRRKTLLRRASAYRGCMRCCAVC